jgi:hypothetical protein
MKRALLLMIVLAAVRGLAEPSTNPPTLGPAPSDDEDIRRIFLRQATAVLSPGAWEVELAPNYTRQRLNAAYAPSDVYRQLSIPLTLRAGLVQRMEAFASVPFSYAEREINSPEAPSSDSLSGVGDVVAGVSVLAVQQSKYWPDTIAAATVSAPTGSDPYDTETPGLGLGSGHWKAAAALQFVSMSDPLVLFWGAKVEHVWEEEFNGAAIQPGDTFGYNFGFAFAANPDISWSMQFIGNYIRELERDGVKQAGTTREPVTLRLGLTRRQTKSLYVEPFVEFGLNDDATEIQIGLAVAGRGSVR